MNERVHEEWAEKCAETDEADSNEIRKNDEMTRKVFERQQIIIIVDVNVVHAENEKNAKQKQAFEWR